MSTRISRIDLFMEIAHLFSQRGTCQRAQVGAVIVSDNRIVSTGYNGAPSGLVHCEAARCNLNDPRGCMRASHAESNAIAFAAKKGIPLEGSILYCTLQPCHSCSQMIINSGIREVWYSCDYRDSTGLMLLFEAGIKATKYA